MTINFNNLIINNLQPTADFENSVVNFINDWFSTKKTTKAQTSGSTGIPKIIEIEKEKMLNSAEMTCDFLGLKEGDSALLCLPVEYISGKMMVVRSIYKNLNLTISEPSTFPLKNLETEIDFCAMTPLQVENSLDKIHLIKKIIIGGSQVSESLKVKIFDAFKNNNSRDLENSPTTNNPQPTTIFETYGMTETLSHIALREIYPNPKDWFTALYGVKISLNKNYCLQISAPHLNDQKIQTNDLVEIKNDKEFRFLGRIDNVINSGGAKIFPEELEAFVKKEIPNEAVFLGIPNEVLGEKLVLIIEGEETENLKSKIQNLKFQKSFHKPKEIIFVEKIPRLPNGKINRISLKNLVLNLKL